MEPTETASTPPATPASLPWSPTERALLLSIALCAAVALHQVLAMLRRI